MILNKTFTLNDFFNDLVMKRRVDRANQRAEEEESGTEAEDADGPSMVETGARSRGNRRIKKENIRPILQMNRGR